MSTPLDNLPPLSVLMYHQVGHYPRPSAHKASFCHIRQFRQQLAYLKWARFNVISMAEAYQGLFHGAPLKSRSVVLTFDDGYQDFHDHAWPALQAYGFPATVFLISGLIGQAARWQTDFANIAQLMDAPTIRRLQGQGVNFGSHAVNHYRLPQLDTADVRREVFDSKATLQDLLGQDVPDFCYPYGQYDERARHFVEEAGYQTGLTCIRGAANTADNSFEIPRKAISYGDNVLGFAWKLHMKHARKRAS